MISCIQGCVALGRVGHRTQDSMESPDGTAEGLCTFAPRTTSHEETILQRMTLEARKPFPTSPSNVLLLSPTISPTSPSSIGTNERERCPSLAEISKLPTTMMKDRTMSMDSEASVCVHPEQHIVSRTHYLCRLQRQVRDLRL
jgi:hypothetical protein